MDLSAVKASAEAVSDAKAPAEAVPAEKVPQETVSEKIPQEAVSEKVPQKAVPAEKVPQKAVPEESLTGDILNRPFIFAVSGYKNSGKTTLLCRLIPELKSRGYRVAVIKHDGHDFVGDVPGTDSFRHRQAGACGCAVFSEKRILITREMEKNDEKVDERMLFKAFPQADIILLEGLKNSSYPKYVCRYPAEPLPSAKELADRIEKAMKAGECFS